jgi:hypothetical protein
VDRHNEEPNIRAGKQIDRYEAVRRRKEGSLVEIPLEYLQSEPLRGNHLFSATQKIS